LLMAELKTKPTKQNPKEFLNTIEPEQKREDGFLLLKMFEHATGEKAVMWGPAIVGFGKYHYKSERSRQEGDWPLVAFSPRKQNLTLYVIAGDNSALLKKLGKHKTSVGCLYINKLSDVDQTVLAELIKKTFEYMKNKTT
jgi:hypothetical protein